MSNQESVSAWTIAKGVLLAVAILTVFGWLILAFVLGGFSHFMKEQVSTLTPPPIVLPQTPRTTGPSLAEAERARRANTPQGRKLYRACIDWRATLERYDVPSVREGERKACDAYDAYIRGR